jgi:hypothetical protein
MRRETGKRDGAVQPARCYCLRRCTPRGRVDLASRCDSLIVLQNSHGHVVHQDPHQWPCDCRSPHNPDADAGLLRCERLISPDITPLSESIRPSVKRKQTGSVGRRARLISGLNRTAFDLALYASQDGRPPPRKTRCRLLAQLCRAD